VDVRVTRPFRHQPWATKPKTHASASPRSPARNATARECPRRDRQQGCVRRCRAGTHLAAQANGCGIRWYTSPTWAGR
jgi:hypothetical protein